MVLKAKIKLSNRDGNEGKFDEETRCGINILWSNSRLGQFRLIYITLG